MGRRTTLTAGQQQTIRSNLARKATQLGNRLVDNALGNLDAELTAGQIKSALGVLGHVLPSMQATTIEDITPDLGTPQEAEQRYQELIERAVADRMKALSPEDIAKIKHEVH